MDQNDNIDPIKNLDTKIKQLKAKRKKLANNTAKEKVDGKKLTTGMLNLINPVLWLKDISSILNIRKLIIYILIIGSIFTYGYIKGIKNKPVHFNMEGKEAMISLNEHRLHILPDGSAQVEDKDGKVLKTIKVKDIPELQKALKPVAIQHKPIGVLGSGIGLAGASFECGVGLSWFKFYLLGVDSFITNKGIYPLGISYKLHKLNMDNSSIGIAGGKGYKGDTRGILYYKWEF